MEHGEIISTYSGILSYKYIVLRLRVCSYLMLFGLTVECFRLVG